MNKVLIYILLMAAGLTITSCENALELTPEQSLDSNIVFDSKNTAKGALIGVYSLAQDLEVFGAMPQFISDFQADNALYIGTFPSLKDIRDFSTLSDNVSIQVIWKDNYALILAATTIIEKVANVEDVNFTAEEKAQMVAEARFMRALVNFQLVSLFAHPYQINGGNSPGIPLITKPFDNEVTLPSRSTVNEVHAAIIEDLTKALPHLPESYELIEETRGRATKGAANGLLSRIYLYRGEWEKAADFATTVISAQQYYKLAVNYSFYSRNTEEEIFCIQNSAFDNGTTSEGGWGSFYEPENQGGRADGAFSSDLLAAFAKEPDDLRFKEKESSGNGAYYTLKFNNAVTNSDNAPVLRVTEMYLNKAEALAELNGVNDESLRLINDLRKRAGLPEWTAADFDSKDKFLDAIANERRKELCFEGHRRMDLLRRGKALRPKNPKLFEKSKPGADKTILPIPQREKDLNPNLVQNPGYGNAG